MASDRPRRSSLFSALVLILFGVLFLLHNYRGGVNLGRIFTHWWPLILILWGLSKLYERTVGARAGTGRSAVISAGEVFLVLGLLMLVGVFALADIIPGKIDMEGPVMGNSYSFDAEVAPRAVPANARVTIRGARGDISVRPADTQEILVTAKKTVRAWSQKDAQRIADPVKVEIAQNGDTYEVRVLNAESGSSRVAVDLEVSVPQKAVLTIRNERGDIEVSDISGELAITTQHGDVDVRGAGADVGVETRSGDVKVSDVKGNVKISGKGGQVEVTDATGGLTVDGEFYGPIRAEKVLKGVRFVSQRTDLTLTQLNGNIEVGSGNLSVSDSTGSLTLRTSSYDLDLENVTGKLKIENRDGNVQVRFTSPPKEDVEITNKSASITLNLPANAAFEIIADCHSGDIDSEFTGPAFKKTTTESGDSHLEGKIGARGPKIILKTSYGSISLHKGT
jgi:DUF4097 and DUF4098 domain-containing protein YvlB